MDPNLASMAAIANGHLVQHHHQQQHPPQYDDSPGAASGGGGAKRKSDDGQQGQSKAKRSRYISLACNECKRRKIKCNGQTPCQRCGNLNLECVYAPNCCTGFKDSAEYKDMAAHLASLQDHINALYENLNNLRATLGHPGPPMPGPPQPYQHPSQHGTPIDPSLQSQGYMPHPDAFGGPQSAGGAHMPPLSPSQARQRSHSQQQQQQQPEQPTFRGPTSTDFNFGVAKSSLQTMGINAQAEQGLDGNGGDPGSGMGTESTAESPTQPVRSMQIIQRMHEDKDPIWTIPREEALRLCRVYEDEMGLMYPLLDIEQVVEYTQRLYGFMDAMRRTGLMQQGFPGADAIDDDDTNILKLVLACALTMEGSGRSELGARIFAYVQPAIDNSLLGSTSVKGIRLLVMTAMYQFHCDNEGTSWRLIGITARLCIELGLHRHETYDAMPDDAERSSTILLFWSIYVLDRRWSFGTGMPFALQDTDIDSLLPRPEERSPYITSMIKYCEIGSKVWRNVAATPSPSNGGGGPINVDEMNYLDYQILQWHRGIPNSLRFEHPSQSSRSEPPTSPSASRVAHRLRILLYLRANQMRILIYRPVLHSATSIMQHRAQAQTVVDVAKDSLRVLTHINQTSDLYTTQQVLFNAFLTSALAVLFLAVSHTPAVFAANVREEFYMALELVRGFSKGSFVSKRLWKTIRGLKEVAPQLGLDSATSQTQPQPKPEPHTIPAQLPRSSAASSQPRDENDPSRSAAVAMAGLAGHDIETLSRGFGSAGWNASGLGGAGSSSPDGMADDLGGLFEAARGLGVQGQGGGFGVGEGVGRGMGDGGGGAGGEGLGEGWGEEGISGILKELF